MSNAPPKRVLVLHGFTQNSRTFKDKIEPFCHECDKRGIELVFLDGAHAVDVDIILEYCDHNPALVEDLEYDVKDPNFRTILEKSGGGPRSWWKRDRAMRTLDLPSHAETLDVVRRALENQRFDGIFGYSQGGALAAIIAAVLEKPEMYPSFIRDGKPIHPPLQFCISISGFRLNDPTGQSLTPTFNTPILHIIGEKDIIVPMSGSQALIELNNNNRVVKHDKAHIVPVTASWTVFYCDFIENPSFEIPAPPKEIGS